MKKILTKTAKPLAIIAFIILVGIIAFLLSERSAIKELYDKFVFARKFDSKVFTEEFQKHFVAPSQKKIDVLRYDVSLAIDFENEALSVKEKILILPEDTTLRQFALNFRGNWHIASVLLNNNKAKYTTHDGHLFITCPKCKDTMHAEIIYNGKPQRAGLGGFVFQKFKNRKYAYTINEPVYASTWLACNDIPYDKAFLRIKIKTDSSYTSISNGELLNTLKKGRSKIFVWQTRFPIAPYLIAVYSGKYVALKDTLNLNKRTIGIRNFVFPEDIISAKSDLEINKTGLKIFSKLFGEYPFTRYGVVEIPWPLGGIENQTISGIGNKYFTGHGFFEDLFLHELSHQWWGNAVTLKKWNELWLNEGFATYSVALFDETIYGKNSATAYMLARKGDFQNATLENPNNEILSPLTYNKGAWFLRMLRYEIGDSAFFNTLRRYFRKLKYKNATAKDFQRMAEETSGQNLNQFFRQWLKEKGILKAKLVWKTHETTTKNFETEISIVQIGKYRDYVFPLEIELKGINGQTLKKKLRITTQETTVRISTPFQVIKIIPDKEEKLLAEWETIAEFSKI